MSELDQTTQTFERPTTVKTLAATLIGAPALILATTVSISSADALIHLGKRNDVCDAKIGQLSTDFYSRAAEGETPILNNVTLDKDEIPSWLQPQVRMPHSCANHTPTPAPSWVRKYTN